MRFSTTLSVPEMPDFLSNFLVTYLSFFSVSGKKECTPTRFLLRVVGVKAQTPTLFLPIGTEHWEQRAYPLRAFSSEWWE